MAAKPVKNYATPANNTYGAGPYYTMVMTLLGGGTGKPPTVPAVSGAIPPCAEEIVGITYNSTGNVTLTFADCYYAIAAWNVSIDDSNGSTPFIGALGQFSNLGAGGSGTPGLPMTCVLTTYTPNTGSNTDMALNTPIRIEIVWKKESTGAAA